MRVPSGTPLHFRWAEAQALERMEASAETVVDSDEQTHRAAVHPRLGMSDPIRPLARGAMRLARVRGVPLADAGDPILYLSRQPTAALTPAFPLASEVAPRTLNV